MTLENFPSIYDGACPPSFKCLESVAIDHCHSIYAGDLNKLLVYASPISLVQQAKTP